MLVAVEFKARVPGVALLLSRVAVDVLALVRVAHLELISGPHAGAASVGWSEEITGQRQSRVSLLEFSYAQTNHLDLCKRSKVSVCNYHYLLESLDHYLDQFSCGISLRFRP